MVNLPVPAASQGFGFLEDKLVCRAELTRPKSTEWQGSKLGKGQEPGSVRGIESLGSEDDGHTEAFTHVLRSEGLRGQLDGRRPFESAALKFVLEVCKCIAIGRNERRSRESVFFEKSLGIAKFKRVWEHQGEGELK